MIGKALIALKGDHLSGMAADLSTTSQKLS